MDFNTKQLIELANNTTYDSLSARTVHECKRRIIDSVACAIGSFSHPLSVSMRALAANYQGNPAVGIWGAGLNTSVDMAAFVNGVMVRVGENSDTFIGNGGGGHPSDMIAGLVAAAEAVNASGRDLIEAVVIAYDVYCGLMDSINLGVKGWDQALHVTLGTTVGAGKLFKLTDEQLSHAISLAVAPNLSLRQTRHGELSSWKGCAGANAARNALFAVTLASHGVDGPASIFEGKQGLWSITGSFEWPDLEALKTRHMVERTSLKPLPVCYHTQSAALAALELRPQLALDQISEIRIDTYQTAVEMAGTGAHQWAPNTPESADHSLPFVVAAALAHGSIEARHFQPDQLQHEGISNFMSKIEVTEDAALTRRWPETAAARLSVRSTSGETVSTEVLYPKGHIQNPMSDAEISDKLRISLTQLSGEEAAERAIRTLWEIDQASVTVTAAFAALN